MSSAGGGEEIPPTLSRDEERVLTFEKPPRRFVRASQFPCTPRRFPRGQNRVPNSKKLTAGNILSNLVSVTSVISSCRLLHLNRLCRLRSDLKSFIKLHKSSFVSALMGSVLETVRGGHWRKPSPVPSRYTGMCIHRGLTFALVAGVALAVAGGTFALVGPHSVDAVASRTKTRHSLALVHVYHGKGMKLGDY